MHSVNSTTYLPPAYSSHEPPLLPLTQPPNVTQPSSERTEHDTLFQRIRSWLVSAEQVKNISRERDEIVEERNSAFKNLFQSVEAAGDNEKDEAGVLNPIHLNDTIDKVDKQFERLTSLQSQLENLKISSRNDTLGTETGSKVVWMLSGLSVLTILAEVGIAIAAFAVEDSPTDSAPFILALGGMIIVILGTLTSSAWYIHEKHKEKADAANQLDKHEIADTRALLELLRSWQTAQRSEGIENQKAFFNTLKDTDESIFKKSAAREDWIAAYIQTIPEHLPLHEKTKRLYELSNAFNETSDYAIHLEDAEQLNNNSEDLDIENQNHASSNANAVQIEFITAWQEVQDMIPGLPLKHLSYRKRIENPIGY